MVWVSVLTLKVVCCEAWNCCSRRRSVLVSRSHEKSRCPSVHCTAALDARECETRNRLPQKFMNNKNLGWHNHSSVFSYLNILISLSWTFWFGLVWLGWVWFGVFTLLSVRTSIFSEFANHALTHFLSLSFSKRKIFQQNGMRGDQVSAAKKFTK